MYFLIVKHLGRKKLNRAEEGRNFEWIFWKFLIFNFFGAWKLTSAHPKSSGKCFQTLEINSLYHFETFIPLKVFWLKHFLGRNPLMKFKNACKLVKIIKKWLGEHNLRSNVRGSNLLISAVSIGPKWAFRVLQTLTSTHLFSIQTRRKSYLRPKLSGPKLVERKNTKLWNLAKFLFKKTFLKGSEMTSADSKLTRKRF